MLFVTCSIYTECLAHETLHAWLANLVASVWTICTVVASYQIACNERSNDTKNLGPVVACFVIIDCTLVIIFHFLLTYTLPGNAVNPGCPVG